MSKIIDHLYLGSYNDIENKFYKEIDTKLIVNVTKECEYESEIEQIMLKYADIPSTNILENIEKILDKIHQCVINEQTVFVHCYMGKSRSVTIILAYLITHQNFTLNEAYVHVKNVRNINPNLGFIKQLISYESKIKSASTLNYDKCAIIYISELLELDENFVEDIYYKNNFDPDDTIDAIFKLNK